MVGVGVLSGLPWTLEETLPEELLELKSSGAPLTEAIFSRIAAASFHAPRPMPRQRRVCLLDAVETFGDTLPRKLRILGRPRIWFSASRAKDSFHFVFPD